jgi:hypothetical protein
MELEKLVEMLRTGISDKKGCPEQDDPRPRQCWVLEQWRKESIPEWQGKLRESIENGDHEGEGYARWMLREILLDPEDQEPEG